MGNCWFLLAEIFSSESASPNDLQMMFVRSGSKILHLILFMGKYGSDWQFLSRKLVWTQTMQMSDSDSGTFVCLQFSMYSVFLYKKLAFNNIPCVESCQESLFFNQPVYLVYNNVRWDTRRKGCPYTCLFLCWNLINPQNLLLTPALNIRNHRKRKKIALK